MFSGRTMCRRLSFSARGFKCFRIFDLLASPEHELVRFYAVDHPVLALVT